MHHCMPVSKYSINAIPYCINAIPYAKTQLLASYSKRILECLHGVFEFESNPNYKPKYDILVCGAILYFDYDAFRLVEWFELTQILAAEHVFLCTIQSSPNANKILKYYILQGFLDVVEWETVVPSSAVGLFQTLVPSCEIHCSQLYQYHSKFIAYYDLDQFIVPRFWGNTFPEFLQNYEPEHGRKYAAPFGEIVFETDIYSLICKRPWQRTTSPSI